MSRSRRAKKKKFSGGIILLAICFAVVAITFFMLHDLQGKAEKVNQESNTVNFVEIVNETEDEEELNNEVEEDTTEENRVEEDNTVKNVVKNTTSVETTNQAPYQPAETDDKQKAIDLVKKEWGEDTSVSFSFEYINENGKYVVSVRDKSSATVKNYFRVDISKGTVELD